MARNPEDRYPSAAELAQELRRFQTGQLVAAHVYSRTDILRRSIRRHRPLSITVGGAALIILAILGGSFFRIVRARTLAEEARDSAIQARADAEKAQREATRRADEVILAQAQTLMDRNPLEALETLTQLSDVAPWSGARVLHRRCRLQGGAADPAGSSGLGLPGALPCPAESWSPTGTTARCGYGTSRRPTPGFWLGTPGGTRALLATPDGRSPGLGRLRRHRTDLGPATRNRPGHRGAPLGCSLTLARWRSHGDRVGGRRRQDRAHRFWRAASPAG